MAYKYFKSFPQKQPNCSACRQGQCGRCSYIREFQSLNSGAVDALDFISLSEAGACGCFRERRDWHWEQYENLRMRKVKSMRTEPKMDRMEVWEAIYRPFPADLKRRGFDYFMSRIADEIHSADQGEDCIGSEIFDQKMNDITLSGHFDRDIVLTVDAAGVKGRRFQEQVTMLVYRLGMEGSVTVQRITTVMRER